MKGVRCLKSRSSPIPFLFSFLFGAPFQIIPDAFACDADYNKSKVVGTVTVNVAVLASSSSMMIANPLASLRLIHGLLAVRLATLLQPLELQSDSDDGGGMELEFC
jgi:hypothetical protein